ncbi:Mrp/NBP35 family ATP-binding protein [Anaeromicrobium sediminis]|nr:Mrp/NBP35 family ATP-binding protein [Anaeromicrobium sediminis]
MSIGKIVGIMSGKGGVGKSSITSLMAVSLSNNGKRVGILDADITGPSIPKVFGINNKRIMSVDNKIRPVKTVSGIKVTSINLMLDNEDDPVVWRGPLVGNMVKQFYEDVDWGELDYLLIDLPPGTGDVPLTIMQSVSLDGVVVVTSPQDLVNLIVKKSIKMANLMGTNIYGVVENMSYFVCDECDKKHYIFGKGGMEPKLNELGVDLLYSFPINPDFTELCDEGRIEVFGKINFDLCEKFSHVVENKIGAIKVENCCI